MEDILIYFQQLNLKWYLTLSLIATCSITLLIALYHLISRIKLFFILFKSIKNPNRAVSLIKARYSPQKLYRRSRLIEWFCIKKNPDLIYQIKLDQIWLEMLMKKKKKKDFIQALRYSFDKCLYKCFLVCLEKKEYAPILISAIEKKGDLFYLRKIAINGDGNDFNSQAAYEIFSYRLDELREMLGDPEWQVRYFALNILLLDRDQRSSRLLWETFKDSNEKIRKKIILQFKTEETDRLYNKLLYLAKNDPIFEVRKVAFTRIVQEFPTKKFLNPEIINEKEAYHLLELLQIDSKEDENFAFYYLNSDNLELRFTAAQFLEKTSTLERLCTEVDLGDEAIIERNYQLLKKASEVNVTGFLSLIERLDNPASLLLCARILLENGDRTFITSLARKVMMIFKGEKDLIPLYQTTMACINSRGNEKALRFLDRELHRKLDNDVLAAWILDAIPGRGDYIFMDSLNNLLKMEDFKLKDKLREVFLKMPTTLVLPVLFEILKSSKYSHIIKIEALKILAAMQLPYCLQFILEHLAELTVSESFQFTEILKQFPTESFKAKVEDLLASCDARVRAAIISILPQTGNKYFLKHIKSALHDPDPDVRVASLWALTGFKDYTVFTEAMDILRDPNETVRLETAQILGRYGSSSEIVSLNNIINDQNEVESVKKAAITGLSYNQQNESSTILCRLLESEDDMSLDIIYALARKKNKDEIKNLVEIFKDASPKLRERLMQVFKLMGPAGEELLFNLMNEENIALKPYISEILEFTGFIENKIRLLSHRDPHIRQETAEFLTRIGTKSAFKGIVIAARDPNEAVRVKVTKALEKLESRDGQELLEALQQDPNKRVRKYTAWALERLKAKSL